MPLGKGNPYPAGPIPFLVTESKKMEAFHEYSTWSNWQFAIDHHVLLQKILSF